METSQPGSAAILAGRGTQWHHVANEVHSTCQPGGMGADVLQLNQQPVAKSLS